MADRKKTDALIEKKVKSKSTKWDQAEHLVMSHATIHNRAVIVTNIYQRTR